LKLVLRGVCLAAAWLAGSSAAQAAPADGGYDWQGLYFGVNAGAATNSSSLENTISGIENGYDRLSRGFDTDDTSLVGGGLLGYNFQMGRVVIGAEADIEYLGFSNARSTVENLTAVDLVSKTSLDAAWLGTLRARLGYTLGGFLVYGTAGLAAGDMSATVSAKATDILSGEYAKWHGSSDEIAQGWTAGAGVEYGISNVSFGVEYIYASLGDLDWNLQRSEGLDSIGDAVRGRGSASPEFSILRATAKMQF